ncbi:MAG: DUF6870 family protein [Christensenellales bacterium]|jgi:hypothetical protein
MPDSKFEITNATSADTPYSHRSTDDNLRQNKSDYAFECGGVSVKLEFDNNGPTLQDAITDFFIRRKNLL